MSPARANPVNSNGNVANDRLVVAQFSTPKIAAMAIFFAAVVFTLATGGAWGNPSDAYFDPSAHPYAWAIVLSICSILLLSLLLALYRKYVFHQPAIYIKDNTLFLVRAFVTNKVDLADVRSVQGLPISGLISIKTPRRKLLVTSWVTDTPQRQIVSAIGVGSRA